MPAVTAMAVTAMAVTAIVRGRKAPSERWVFENIKVIGKSNSIINYTCLLLANTFWKLRHLEKARWYKTLILYLYYKRDVPKSKLLLAAAVHSPEQWAELNFLPPRLLLFLTVATTMQCNAMAHLRVSRGGRSPAQVPCLASTACKDFSTSS